MFNPAHHSLPLLPWGALIGASLLAAVIDLRSGRIPNWLTAPLFVAGLIWAACSGGTGQLLDGLATALLLALPFVVLFVIAGGGAADAKLMGALGVWLGVRSGCTLLVVVCLCGVVVGLGYALGKRQARDVFANLRMICVSLFCLLHSKQKWSRADVLMPDTQKMLPMPYGLAIFMGVLVVALRVYLA